MLKLILLTGLLSNLAIDQCELTPILNGKFEYEETAHWELPLPTTFGDSWSRIKICSSESQPVFSPVDGNFTIVENSLLIENNDYKISLSGPLEDIVENKEVTVGQKMAFTSSKKSDYSFSILNKQSTKLNAEEDLEKVLK